MLTYRYDFVQIRDGENGFATEIVTLSGNYPGYHVESTGNTLFINFQSDYVTGDTGFKIKYEAGKRYCRKQTLFQYLSLNMNLL